MSNVATLPVFDLATIRKWGPCYDPMSAKFSNVQEDWKGTALDVLKHPEIPAKDKLWLVCREDCIDARTLRLFAARCARRALSLIPESERDQRSSAACDVAERFANGEATAEELAAARAAAWDVAWAAARAAARDAAWDAARDAAWAAARAAAWDVACAAAWDVAWAAARAAAWDVACAAAWDVACAAASAAQVEILIDLLEGGK